MPKSTETTPTPSKTKDKISTDKSSNQNKKTSKKASSSKLSKILVKGVFLLVILLIAGSLIYYFSQNKQNGEPSGSPEPTLEPGPIRPLPEGKQVYHYSSSNVKGPVPSEVTIDPLTPNVKTVQTIFVKINYSSPITSASVNLHTDNKVTNFPLELVEGTTSEGTWKGSWLMPGTYNYNYYLEFDIKSDQDNYKGGMRFR